MHPLEKFFALLRPLKGKFHIYCREIRTKKSALCPILAITAPWKCESNNLDYSFFGRKIGLSYEQCHLIARASDVDWKETNYGQWVTEYNLRKKLIQFLEIKEEN